MTDYIIVGGGTAGCVLAARLSEDPDHSVLLLEAGDRDHHPEIHIPATFSRLFQTDADWNYHTEPQAGAANRALYWPRGKVLGGSSSINAMIYIRGNAWDYDNWAAMGCDGWSYEDVLPWFRKAEANERGADEYHGAGGPLFVSDQHWPNESSRAFVESAAALQFPERDDFNGAHQAGFGIYQVTQRKGERWSASRAYVEPIRNSENLDIRTGTVVEHLVIEGGRVTGVAIRKGSRRETIFARRGVILSAGAFNSPQILMLSGIGPGRHLRALDIPVALDRPAVGSNLQDHIDYVSSWQSGSRVPIGNSREGTLRMLGAIVEHRRKRTGAMTTPYAEAGGFWTVGENAPAPDVQWHFVPAMLEDHGREKVSGHGVSLHACVLRPESRGTVRLASPDAVEAPAIDPNFLDDDRDIAVLREGVRLSHRIADVMPLAGYGLADRHPVDLSDDDALDAMIRQRADTVYHPVGTCRMGSDEDAVVDPTLKARGIDGLWIADASVMPRIVSGNTNAPAIMIGERCADFVMEAEKAA